MSGGRVIDDEGLPARSPHVVTPVGRLAAWPIRADSRVDSLAAPSGRPPAPRSAIQRGLAPPLCSRVTPFPARSLGGRLTLFGDRPGLACRRSRGSAPARSVRGGLRRLACLTGRFTRGSLRSPADRRSAERSLASLARTPWSIAPRALLRRLRRTPLTRAEASLRSAFRSPFGYSAAACAAALASSTLLPSRSSASTKNSPALNDDRTIGPEAQ